MKTATAVLTTIPASYRLARKAEGRCMDQVDYLANCSEVIVVAMLAQGIMYADSTGRTTGTVSMALRRATPWQAGQLIAAMVRDGIDLIHQVPAWLNANALGLLV